MKNNVDTAISVNLVKCDEIVLFIFMSYSYLVNYIIRIVVNLDLYYLILITSFV